MRPLPQWREAPSVRAFMIFRNRLVSIQLGVGFILGLMTSMGWLRGQPPELRVQEVLAGEALGNVHAMQWDGDGRVWFLGHSAGEAWLSTSERRPDDTLKRPEMFAKGLKPAKTFVCCQGGALLPQGTETLWLGHGEEREVRFLGWSEEPHKVPHSWHRGLNGMLSGLSGNELYQMSQDGRHVRPVATCQEKRFTAFALREDGQWLLAHTDTAFPLALASHGGTVTLPAFEGAGTLSPIHSLCLNTATAFPLTDSLLFAGTAQGLWSVQLSWDDLPPDSTGWVSLYHPPKGWIVRQTLLSPAGKLWCLESHATRGYSRLVALHWHPSRPVAIPVLDGMDACFAALREAPFPWRQHAQDRLVASADREAWIPKLQDSLFDPHIDANGFDSQALHALWILQQWGCISGEHPESLTVVAQAMRHPSPSVRRTAMLLYPSDLLADLADDLAPVEDDDVYVVQDALLAMSKAPPSDALGKQILARLQAQRWILRLPSLRELATHAAVQHASGFLAATTEEALPADLESPRFRTLLSHVWAAFSAEADKETLAIMKNAIRAATELELASFLLNPT